MELISSENNDIFTFITSAVTEGRSVRVGKVKRNDYLDESLLAIGVATCTVLICVDNHGNKTIAHVPPGESVSDYLRNENFVDDIFYTTINGPFSDNNEEIEDTRYIKSNFKVTYIRRPFVKEDEMPSSYDVILAPSNEIFVVVN